MTQDQDALYQLRLRQLQPLLLRHKPDKPNFSLLSVGCGTGAEFFILKPYTSLQEGVELDQRAITFCKDEHPCVHVHQTNYMFYLDTTSQTFDFIVALDIDTDMFPQRLLELAYAKLSDGGKILFTERQENISIYGRLLLYPYLEQLQQQFATKYHFCTELRFNKKTSTCSRDEVVFIATKK